MRNRFRDVFWFFDWPIPYLFIFFRFGFYHQKVFWCDQVYLFNADGSVKIYGPCQLWRIFRILSNRLCGLWVYFLVASLDFDMAFFRSGRFVCENCCCHRTSLGMEMRDVSFSKSGRTRQRLNMDAIDGGENRKLRRCPCLSLWIGDSVWWSSLSSSIRSVRCAIAHFENRNPIRGHSQL